MSSRPEELRDRFAQYGEIRDVYLPRDYYTNRPKGFGFVEFRDERDADDALDQLNGSQFGGREISVVMSKENRKTPREMVRREDQAPPRSSRGYGGGGGGDYQRDSRDGYRDRDSHRDSYRDSHRDSHRDSYREPQREPYRDSRREGRARSRSRSPRKSSRRSYSREASPPRREASLKGSPVRSRPRSRSASPAPVAASRRTPSASPPHRSPAAAAADKDDHGIINDAEGGDLNGAAGSPRD